MYFPPDIPSPLIVIVGATAVGKTDVAIQLALRLGGEVVSADSRLFYRGMDIGTAKPTRVETQGVVHHLIDVTNPDETWSLPVYQEAAHKVIKDIQSRRRLPFLVGGSGQYLCAITEGWEVPPFEPDNTLREALEKWADEIGTEGLYLRLGQIDPQAAEHIQPKNRRRIIRALEVIFSSGKKFSEQQLKKSPPYAIKIIGLNRPREELYLRIDQRIDVMIANGWVEEAKTLLEKGYAPNLPALSAIGYHEIIAALQGEMSIDEAIVLIKRGTRQFVRHQANWFKNVLKPSIWFDFSPDLIDQAEAFIRSESGWRS